MAVIISAEDKLRERIKELTCLYEVTSIIVNCDYDQIETSLEAIAYCMEKAWLHVDDTFVIISTESYTFKTPTPQPKLVSLKLSIKVFNKDVGYIEVGYPASRYSQSEFLEEEHKLLQNICLDVGNLLERKQIRDNEIVIKRQMERADRLNILGEITAGIAHELNTPLANILGFSELLQSRITDPKSIKDLERIVDNTIFCREVVKKLMFFTCEMPQNLEIVHLNPVVQNVLNLLDPTFKKQKITYTQSFNKKNIELRADTVQLTQVFFNLLINAIYYSPENGNIDIKVAEIKDRIHIKITDEGSGIDKNIEDKIFEPFFTTKPMGEGTGLGLSVVHGIVNSHKGSILHKPNKPKGTVFILDLPKL